MSGLVSLDLDGRDVWVAGGFKGERWEQGDAETSGHEGLGDDVVIGAVADIGPKSVTGSGCGQVRAAGRTAGDPSPLGGVDEGEVGTSCEWVSAGDDEQDRVVEQRCLR